MRAVDKHSGFHVPNLFPDRLWAQLYGEAIDIGGMVLDLHMCGGGSISAPQLELHCWSILGRSNHSRWIHLLDLDRVRR